MEAWAEATNYGLNPVWNPVGYYSNRPHIFAGCHEIGFVEYIRFIHSEPYPDLLG